MSSFLLEFDCDNDAFGNEGDFNEQEVARILDQVAKDVRRGSTHSKVLDYNGNKVGSWMLEIDDPETEDEDE